MRTCYHVTPVENLPDIARHGLVPSIGERSVACGETDPAIYLFSSMAAVEDAFGGWMEKCFDEEARLALLAVQVGADAAPNPGAEYEMVVRERIDVGVIVVLSRDLLGETDIAALAARPGGRLIKIQSGMQP